MTAFHPEFTSLPGRYAKAFFERASPKHDIEHILTQSRNFMEILGESPDLARVLLKPLVGRKVQLRVLARVMKVCHFTGAFQDFMLMIARHGRLGLMKKIFEVLERIYFASKNLRPVTVVTAYPASQGELRKLADFTKASFGKNVAIQFSTNPALIAGYRVEIDGKVYDASLKKQLTFLKHSILEGSL